MTLIHQHLIGLCVRLKRLLHIVYLFLLTGVLRSQVYRSKHTPVELADAPAAYLKRQKKPEWVTRKIIYLKAMMPSQGCRKISEVFNRLHGEKDFMTVSKSYVYTVFVNYKQAIYQQRKLMRNQSARTFPAHRIWSIDLTTLTDDHAHQHKILGILDNGTRANLCLQRLDKPDSLQLIIHILESILRYGKPRKFAVITKLFLPPAGFDGPWPY